MKRPSSARMARLSTVFAACVAGLMASASAQAGEELYGWRGFYVGALGTYSFINQDINFKAPVAASGSADLSGIGGTGLVGYRIPLGSERFRIGVELDGAVGDNHAGFNRYRFVSDFTTSARGTLGVHLHPDLLWFATAGVAWMGINSSSAGTSPSILGGAALTDKRTAKTVFGGVVGTGLEWDMNKAIHLRGDYLYGAFDSHRADTGVSDKTISTEAHQIRLGLVVSLQNPYDEPHGRGSDIDRDRYAREPMK